MLEKHGLLVKKELKSELYYSNILCKFRSEYCIMPTCNLAGVTGIG